MVNLLSSLNIFMGSLSEVTAQVREDGRDGLAWVLGMLRLWRLSVRLKLAVRMADMKQKAFNRRYYVMLLEYGGRDRLVSVSRDDINRFKRRKWLPKNFSHIDAQEAGFYQTDLSRNRLDSAEAREAALRKYRRYVGR